MPFFIFDAQVVLGSIPRPPGAGLEVILGMLIGRYTEYNSLLIHMITPPPFPPRGGGTRNFIS